MIHAANIVYISILLASQDEENHLLLPKKKVKRERPKIAIGSQAIAH